MNFSLAFARTNGVQAKDISQRATPIKARNAMAKPIADQWTPIIEGD